MHKMSKSERFCRFSVLIEFSLVEGWIKSSEWTEVSGAKPKFDDSFVLSDLTY